MTLNIPLRVSVLLIAGFWILTNADSLSIHIEMNKYYEKMDESFSRIARSTALKSTSLSGAEKLFVREMKKNRAYYTLIRTNSKGKVISEAVRGKKVERPNTDVVREKWFQTVKKTKEPYYSIIRDDDRGRYYLIWSKPVIKNNNFVGTVTAKIDLWDSFYEFSNSVYYPFLVRLNNLSLFSHKWNNDFTYKEERLTVPGINRISVRYIPEKKGFSVAVKDTSKIVSDTDVQTAPVIQKSDTAKDKIASAPKDKKGNPAAVLIITIIVIVAGGAMVALVIVSRNRRKAFLKELDEEQ